LTAAGAHYSLPAAVHLTANKEFWNKKIDDVTMLLVAGLNESYIDGWMDGHVPLGARKVKGPKETKG